jgi:release factor glutamine methyltransferase
MITYKGLVNDATQQIYSQSETPRIDAEVLIQHVTGKSMAWFIAFGDTPANAEHIKLFYELVSRRGHGEPIAYLTGVRDFWTLTLKVDKNVLIPRPDTEALVDSALENLVVGQTLDVLDLGTGSGAIALSIAKERSMANVIATDLHEGALTVAKSNAVDNNISNVEFRQGGWFSPIDEKEKFDLIASNPPYVEPGDVHLSQGDLRFEPMTALVANDNGLADLHNIIENAPHFLKDGATLIVEHGYNQAEQVSKAFAKNGFERIELIKDINNLPRCTRGQWSRSTK